jgi:hypothetical protein
MPVCTICQGDGVAEVLGRWYCVEHIEHGFIDLGRFLAEARGWDVDETEDALLGWLDS